MNCFIWIYIFYFIWILKRAKQQNFNNLEYLCDKKAAIMRNFISQFHRKLCVFVTSYSDAVQREARRKGLATFNKTRFASHRRFLVSCLDKKVVPNGFLLKFHGQSLKCRKIVKNCSFNLMRDSLRENNFKLQRHSKDIDYSTEKLKVWCTSIEFGEICQYIHQCNKELHVIFEEIKSKKLKSLLPPVKEISENKLVVAIPSDLPLDSSECSLLGKGLGFVPTNRKPEKFQSLQDLSKFYRKIRLHAFFNNLDQDN